MKMPLHRLCGAAFGAVALLVSSQLQASAQTANFTNLLGGDWNTAANWDLDFTGVNVVPAEGTNATITSAGAVIVNYTSPMAATSFGSLSVDGGATLNINAAGFTQNLGGVGVAPLTLGSGIVNVGSAGVWTATNGGSLTVNLGGDLNVAGNAYFAPLPATAPFSVAVGGSMDVTTGGTLTFADGGSSTVLGAVSVTDGSLVLSNCQSLIISPGATVTVTNGTVLQTASLAGSIALGVNNNNTTTLFTMYGGNVTFDRLLDIRGRKSGFIVNGGTLNANGGTQLRESSTDDINRLVVAGGTANLGATEVNRTASGGGLILSNGVINTTSLRIGVANSTAYSTITGGALTNTGLFTICDRNNGAAGTTDRRARLLVRGGTVVSTGPQGIIVANQANAQTGAQGANIIAGILDINAGTIVAEGITLVKDNTLTNAHAQMILAGSGAIFLGSVGLNGNVGPVNSSYSLTLSGGTLGAKAGYTANANGTMSGTFTVQASDVSGSPFNITNTAVWSGTGALRKTGGGALVLTANNTYSGATAIDNGSLVLVGAGGIGNSPSITLASGASFDCSGATAAYTLAATRTLAGFGSVIGNFTNASGSTINPGTNTFAGTLSFSGSLNQSGGAVNHFDLPTTPGPGNDRINITGDLNVSGVNTIEVVGGGSPGTVHTLIQYSGAFNGSLANFNLSGASGTLSNNPTTKTIALVIASAVRNPTNVVWLGNVSSNSWDTVNLTNWLHTGLNTTTYFVANDNVLFNDAGIANNNVNLVGNNAPATLTVGAAGNYTFGGVGAISGSTGLVKTNSGTLTINTVNSYSGVTEVSGGVLEAATLANGGNNSSIGSASTDPANLLINNATFRYTGGTVSVNRGATLGAGLGAVGVSTAGSTLTVGGAVNGAGTLVKTGAGILALGSAGGYTGGSVISNGVLQLNTSAAAGAAGITNYNATLRVSGATTEDNQIDFRGTCALEFTGVGSGNVPVRGAWTGDGIVNVNFLTQNTSQTLSIGGEGAGGGHMWDFSGTVDFGSMQGFARLNNNASINFGSSNAIFNLGTASLIFVQRNGGTTTHLGALLGGPNTRLSGARNDVSGTTTYSIGGRNLDTIFEGMITNGQSGSSIRPASIIKVGTGKLTLTGLSPYTGVTTIENGTLQVDGQITASPITVNAGTLSGNGSLGGAVTINPNSTLSPGASVGLLTMTSSLQMVSGSTNYFEIDRANGTNDSVRGMSSVSFGGTLVVTNLGGSFASGDRFVLFEGAPGNYSGVFDNITLPTLPTGLVWDTSNLTVDGSISVNGPTLNVVNNGTSLNFSWTGTFKLQVQTNNLATGLSNNWADYPGGGTSPISVSVNPAAPAVFFRLSSP